jgi:leucyl aminopeptidase
MLIKQKDFNLENENKNLILNFDFDNPLVRLITEKLNIKKDQLKNDIEVFSTLGLINSQKVVFVKEANLKEKIRDLGKIINVEEDFLILIDSFSKNLVLDLANFIVQASYRFENHKSKTNDKKNKLYYFSDLDIEEDIFNGIVYGEAVNNTKNLVNTPYNYLNAEKLAKYSKGLASIENVTVKVYGKEACESMNMGAFLGVNKGSKDEPQLIHLRYNGKKDSADIVSLVGKGVMYDTGGYSLKTTTGMPSMKCDMAGAATVLGAFEIAAKIKLSCNLDVVIAATDNRIGDNAIVPDDIITAANGTTIEILSTDAEGRLTLADALWFAQKEGATKLIDVATLTGAVIGALGKEYTGAFTNNQALLDKLLEVSNDTKEKIWQLPITKAFHDELKSYSADIKNSSGNRLAGASVAAAFLEKFIEKENSWIHLDIAGTAFSDKTGATGIMVETLVEFIKTL